MEHLKTFFIKVRLRIKLWILAIRLFILIPFTIIRDYIITRRILANCPDEESKNRALLEMMQEDDQRYEEAIRKMHLRHAMTLASIDFVHALSDQYSYPDDPSITEDTHLAAPKRFVKAKDGMLMNARWLVLAGEEYLEKYIALLEPVQIDTYVTDVEWDEFLKKLSDSSLP